MTKNDFDIEIFLDNITYYCEQRKMKIGELEQLSGVSTGYFSRVRKKAGDKIPKMHIALAVAANLQVPLEMLATVRASGVDANTQHKMKWIAAIGNLTIRRQMQWYKIKLDKSKIRIPGILEHNLLPCVAYPAVTKDGEGVIPIQTSVPNKVFCVTSLSYAAKGEACYCFTEGYLIPNSFINTNWPMSSKDMAYALWIIKNELLYPVMIGEANESFHVLRALQALKDPINQTQAVSEEIAPEIKAELDNLLKEDTFMFGV